MRKFNLLLAVSTAAAVLLASLSASAQTAAVKPVLERVVECTNRPGFQAVWGYANSNSSEVTIPIGSSGMINSFSPLPNERGQNTVFLQGRQVAVFRTDLEPGVTLVWLLRGPDNRTRTATATSGSSTRRLQECPIPDPAPSPEPI